MSERRKGGWWRYPGDRIRVVLAFTAAGLVVSALLLALTCFLPKKGYVGGPVPDDPLKAMAGALKGIEKSLSGARDLSITVELDKDQWKKIDKRLQNLSANATVSSVESVSGRVNAIADSVKEIAGNTGRIAAGVEKISNETGAVARGVKDIAMGVKNVSVEAGAIATDVKKIAGNTGRIETGVENVSNKANAIASSVEGIATGVKNVSGKTDAIAADVKDIADGMGGGIVVIGGLGGMTRPWACRGREIDKCLGVVHFPHNWPPEPDSASDECRKKWEWKKSGSKEPMREELNSIITKLENKKLSQPVWIVGHASTLGTELHNNDLSMRRAKFVACHLEKTLKWDDNVRFKTCAVGVGERGSADSLRHPDAWYRVVQVFAKEPQALIENPSWECSE